MTSRFCPSIESLCSLQTPAFVNKAQLRSHIKKRIIYENFWLNLQVMMSIFTCRLPAWRISDHDLSTSTCFEKMAASYWEACHSVMRGEHQFSTRHFYLLKKPSKSDSGGRREKAIHFKDCPRRLWRRNPYLSVHCMAIEITQSWMVRRCSWFSKCSIEAPPQCSSSTASQGSAPHFSEQRADGYGDVDILGFTISHRKALSTRAEWIS